MNKNPYEAPAHRSAPRSNWRRFWRLACFASFCFAGMFLVADLLLRAVADDAHEADWFIILSGSLALGQLASLTFVGVSGIGWVISRRHGPAAETSEQLHEN